MKNLRILNLGAGVQSTAVALMVHRGKLPPIDAAIFADTQEEADATYAHLDWLEQEVKGSFPVHRVTKGRLGDDLANGRGGAGQHSSCIPAFTINGDTRGITGRQCTGDYKIEPINQFVRRSLLGLKPKHRSPKSTRITQIFGLSLDEPGRVARVRHSSIEKGFYPDFPLFELSMTRRDCVTWLEQYPVPHPVPRSACVFCPYKTNSEWARLKELDAPGWQRAVEIDEVLRTPGAVVNRTMKSTMFLHRSCVPLAEADLRSSDVIKGQGNFDFNSECQGMCGV